MKITTMFEVWPSAGGRDSCLEIAFRLRAHLEAIDGFIALLAAG